MNMKYICIFEHGVSLWQVRHGLYVCKIFSPSVCAAACYVMSLMTNSDLKSMQSKKENAENSIFLHANVFSKRAIMKTNRILKSVKSNSLIHKYIYKDHNVKMRQKLFLFISSWLSYAKNVRNIRWNLHRCLRLSTEIVKTCNAFLIC